MNYHGQRPKGRHTGASSNERALRQIISSDNLSISFRLSTKTVANNKEDATSMDLNNKLKELIEKPL